MASPRHPTTIDNLPCEILLDIFIRLLAKQLAQMRCVCKPWNALLSDSSFVKSHLSRSIHHNDQILLFFSNDSSSITARPSSTPGLEPTNFTKLPVNLHPKNNQCIVIGSVNGLICFSYELLGNDPIVHIWNPSLSALLTLPPWSLPFQNEIKLFDLQFGFDPQTDDYKIVKLTCLDEPYKIVPQVEVYSMRRGSWELISQRFPSNITFIQYQNEVCVDGHAHWLCNDDLEGKPDTIVGFDLGAETFREIPLPDSLLHHPRYNELGVLGGKLCVMSCVVDGECEVWVMDEYGVPESWVKHHAFSQFSGYICPYGFTSRNEFLFQVGGRFGLYDPVAAKTKTFKIFGGHDIYKVVEYVDSLVWVAPAKCQRSSIFQSILMSCYKGKHIYMSLSIIIFTALLVHSLLSV